LIEAGFRPGANMCECAIDDLPWLRVWAPEALVLPLGVALSLANRKQLGLFDLPSLNTAIVVLTSFDDSPLAARHRDLLWRAFGVPVFEQLRGSDGAVIASECEVHDGLHMIESLPGTRGEVVTDHCACGAETPRLRSPPPVRAKVAIGVAPSPAIEPALTGKPGRSRAAFSIAALTMGYFTWNFISIYRFRAGQGFGPAAALTRGVKLPQIRP
jgi:hypothetical protein